MQADREPSARRATPRRRPRSSTRFQTVPTGGRQDSGASPPFRSPSGTLDDLRVVCGRDLQAAPASNQGEGGQEALSGRRRGARSSTIARVPGMRGAVSIEGVRKAYGDVVELDRVSLAVRPGEFLRLEA